MADVLDTSSMSLSYDDTANAKQRLGRNHLEHIAAFVLHKSLLVIWRLAGPVGLEAGSCLFDLQQTFPFLVHKAPADALNVGQVHPHQLSAILWVKASERQARPISAIYKQASSLCTLTITSHKCGHASPDL